MPSATSYMYQEANDASKVIEQQLSGNAALMRDLAAKIKQFNPSFVVLVGRGSSDHAGLFAKYLIEVETGLPVLHAAPSVTSVFQQQLKLGKALVIAISQSGQSPDIVGYMKMARDQGALTAAMVNVIPSPLSDIVDCVIPLSVGTEQAVAATKSFLGSLSALLQLVANYTNSSELLTAIDAMPAELQKACLAEPTIQIKDLAKIDHCVVMGRGFGYAIGMELALKLKEVCAIHAECFSSAEFMHGPVRIVSHNFRILDIQVADETLDTHLLQSAELTSRGAALTPIRWHAQNTHPRIIPAIIMQRCYLDLEYISRAMGYNPDKPEGLAKVTETH